MNPKLKCGYCTKPKKELWVISLLVHSCLILYSYAFSIPHGWGIRFFCSFTPRLYFTAWKSWIFDLWLKEPKVFSFLYALSSILHFEIMNLRFLTSVQKRLNYSSFTIWSKRCFTPRSSYALVASSTIVFALMTL